MKHKRASVIAVGLAAIGLLWGAAIADPGNGHGPPPGKGPGGNGKPSMDKGGSTNAGGNGKGSCVRTCQQSRRDCNKDATTERKACYTLTCASQRAAVVACDGGGDGVSDQGAQDGVTDGVTDDGGGCDAAAHELKKCLEDCRIAFKATKRSCTDTVRGCKIDCGLPFRTPTPIPVPTP